MEIKQRLGLLATVGLATILNVSGTPATVQIETAPPHSTLEYRATPRTGCLHRHVEQDIKVTYVWGISVVKKVLETREYDHSCDVAEFHGMSYNPCIGARSIQSDGSIKEIRCDAL